MQVSRENLDVLCRIAREAGAAIMSVYRRDVACWSKDDDSPLTEADLLADAIIRSGLEAAFPGRFILSEESVSAATTDEPATFFLVDPLDGTKEFLRRNDEFTVNIALVHHGMPVVGVVLAPALDELFFAARGLGAWWRSGQGEAAPLRAARADPARPLRVIGSRSHGGEALADWLAGLEAGHTFVAAGSSLKFCRIAQGQADIYPRLGPTCQWDTAAAQCVLEMAGGIVLDPAGQSLRYGLDRAVLNPVFLATGGGTTPEVVKAWAGRG